MQRSGLPIGPDITRAAARILMLATDQQFIRLARNNKMECYMYRRYVDDTADCAEMRTPGVRWSEEEGSMVMHHNLVEDDRNSPPDVRTAREVAKMAISINLKIGMALQLPLWYDVTSSVD